MGKFEVNESIEDGQYVDNFAGGGGASQGILQATGKEVDIAINHNAEALEMHAKNHPGTRHFCESVFDIDPLEVTNGRPVGILWLSPDCTHHSNAKGGQPRKQGIRGLAWIALRWILATKPKGVYLENVPEFSSWSPLDENGFPIKERKGETFDAFVACLSSGIAPGHPAIDEIKLALGNDFPIQHLLNGLGYNVEHRVLKACDYGAPTIRKRLFLVARRDGAAVVWPNPTHADPKKKDIFTSGLKPWKTAADCINWEEPTKSIFGRKKPLAINTLKRIARGVKKFVLDSADPFIVSLAHGEESPTGVKRWGSGVRDLNLPLQTVLASGNGAAVVQPFLAKFRGDSAGVSLLEPMPTITSGGQSARPAGSPHALGLVGAQLGAASNDQTIRAATLIQTGYGEREGQKPRVMDLNRPLGTVVAGGSKHALVELCGIAANVEIGEAPDTHDKPMPDTRGCMSIGAIAKFRQGSPGSPLGAPLDTVAASGLHHGLMVARIEQVQAVAGEPGSIDVAATRLQQTRAFAKEFLGLDRLLVKIKGEYFEVVDIFLRMLTPKELFKAQGFPDGYVFEFVRNGKPLSKSAQVRMCGNSVCPPVAEALVRANHTMLIQSERKVA